MAITMPVFEMRYILFLALQGIFVLLAAQPFMTTDFRFFLAVAHVAALQVTARPHTVITMGYSTLWFLHSQRWPLPMQLCWAVAHVCCYALCFAGLEDLVSFPPLSTQRPLSKQSSMPLPLRIITSLPGSWCSYDSSRPGSPDSLNTSSSDKTLVANSPKDAFSKTKEQEYVRLLEDERSTTQELMDSFKAQVQEKENLRSKVEKHSEDLQMLWASMEQKQELAAQVMQQEGQIEDLRASLETQKAEKMEAEKRFEGERAEASRVSAAQHQEVEAKAEVEMAELRQQVANMKQQLEASRVSATQHEEAEKKAEEEKEELQQQIASMKQQMDEQKGEMHALKAQEVRNNWKVVAYKALAFQRLQQVKAAEAFVGPVTTDIATQIDDDLGADAGVPVAEEGDEDEAVEWEVTRPIDGLLPEGFGKLLGRGSYGCVYEYSDEDVPEGVVKRFAPNLEITEAVDFKSLLDFAADGFFREADILARLSMSDHPYAKHVVGYRAYVEETRESGLWPRRYIIMDRCHGDLATLVREEGPLDDLTSLYLMQHLMKGLILLRDHRVINTDIKPDNVLWTRKDDDEGDGQYSFYLADMGMAEDADEDGEADTTGGTVWYQAGEIVNESRATYASDLFACYVTFQMARRIHHKRPDFTSMDPFKRLNDIQESWRDDPKFGMAFRMMASPDALERPTPEEVLDQVELLLEMEKMDLQDKMEREQRILDDEAF